MSYPIENKVYVAGAWVEQHTRARVWIAKLRAVGITITCDWTRAEGEVIYSSSGKVVTGDSDLDPEDRRKYALADLQGVLDADVVWMMAPDDKGSAGAWVELGAALALHAYGMAPQAWVQRGPADKHRVIVSGPKARRSIFTELAEIYDTDEEAFAAILMAVGRPG
jgi:hypothetical protein